MDAIDVRELQRNFFECLTRVQDGEVIAVTEHGREVARLIPADPNALNPPPAGPPPVEEILDEMREERL